MAINGQSWILWFMLWVLKKVLGILMSSIFYLNILSQFSPCLIFFAPHTINTIRWPLRFRQLVRFRIIPWCEWYLMFPFPFSIPLVSSNNWGRHDIVNLRAFWFVRNNIFWFFRLWDCLSVALGLKISTGKQFSVALGLKINMGKKHHHDQLKWINQQIL